jgi:hypothetical protein
MTAYSPKVNTDGTYRPFHGYTVVSMLKDDLTVVEEYIKGNPVLSTYFAALPAASYHMTLFNIWCHGRGLLPTQKKWIGQMEGRFRKAKIEHELLKRTHPNCPGPGQTYSSFRDQYLTAVRGEHSCGFINEDLFTNLMNKVTDVTTMAEFGANIVASSSIHGLRTEVALDDETRATCIRQRALYAPIVGHADAQLSPHVTLAYRYRDIPAEHLDTVHAELANLNAFVASQTKNGVRFSAPRFVWFDSMTRYMSCEEMYG